MRPVLRRVCSMTELKDGSLDLADVARLNDALDVEDENERRAQAAAKASN